MPHRHRTLLCVNASRLWAINPTEFERDFGSRPPSACHPRERDGCRSLIESYLNYNLTECLTEHHNSREIAKLGFDPDAGSQLSIPFLGLVVCKCMCELQVSAGVSQVQVLREAVTAVSLPSALACGESLVPAFCERGDDQVGQVLLQALEVLSEKRKSCKWMCVCVCV